MSMKTLNGKKVAIEINNYNKRLLEKLTKLNNLRRPKLAIILIGNNSASELYIKNKILICKEVGIGVHLIRLKEDIELDFLLRKLSRLNDNKNIDGILLQFPLPVHLEKYSSLLNEKISKFKDVDCFNPYNVAMLNYKQTQLVPATALAVIVLLRYYKIAIASRDVVVIGRSQMVGSPLAKVLTTLDATVTLCHSKTQSLQNFTKKADIVICAIGSPKYFNRRFFTRNSIIIDVGINHDLEKKLCGDVDFDDVFERVKALSPVPNGIGPLTVAMLIRNTLLLYANKFQIDLQTLVSPSNKKEQQIMVLLNNLKV